jgi:hypothetical protein
MIKYSNETKAVLIEIDLRLNGNCQAKVDCSKSR